MPTNLYFIPGCCRKTFKLTCIFLFLPLFFCGQSLTGLWIGSVSNDSSTVRKDQSFEIALTEYKGKVYGYSRSEFIVDDVLYYIVKRVSGTIEGDMCEVTDDEIISYNFPKLLDKKVKVTSTFRRDKNDSTWYLAGKWKTNVTKKYYSVSGKVDLEQEKDLTASKIFPHLEELKLADAVAFYKERKEGEPIVKIAKPEKTSIGISAGLTPLTTHSDAITVADKSAFQKNNTGSASGPSGISTMTIANETTKEQTSALPPKTETTTKEPEVTNTLTAIKKADNIQRTETKNIPVTKVDVNPSFTKTTVVAKPAAENKNIAAGNEPVNVNKATVANSSPDPEMNNVAKQTPVIKTQPVPGSQQIEKTNSLVKTKATEIIPVEKKENASKPDVAIEKTGAVAATTSEKKIIKPDVPVTSLVPAIKAPPVDITLKAAVIAGRKSEFSQQVNFKSDSLLVSLYDNGEIDGDTVSVFMNGDVIMANQGLRSTAIRKTIYLTPGQEEFTLVLFAENLGKYPPNTGLLVVRDGDDVYNLRFSSDYQKNTGIVFRRKK